MSERGERGPRGDHGQTGDTGNIGPEGPQGESTVLSRNITGSFVALTVVFVLILGGLVYVITENRQLAREGEAAHDVLCGLGLNIVQRIERSEKYLADVEAGTREPVAGISIREVQESIRRDHDSIQQFEALDCVPPIEHRIEGGSP